MFEQDEVKPLKLAGVANGPLGNAVYQAFDDCRTQSENSDVLAACMQCITQFIASVEHPTRWMNFLAAKMAIDVAATRASHPMLERTGARSRALVPDITADQVGATVQ